MDDACLVTEDSVWLTLLRAPPGCHQSILQYLRAGGEPRALLRHSKPELQRAGLDATAIRYLAEPDLRGVESDRKWLQEAENFLLPFDSPRYPPLLREIPDPPLALFGKGSRDVLELPQLAVVGSRRPSPDGRRNARDFARRLAGCGLTVTSGLAEGIDAGAHEGALEVRAPTVAVLGNGLDTVYPPANRRLAARVAEHGALVAEVPVGTPPLAANFPRRNRIISGLSVGVLVVEAALRSGSLITARHAANQGREVFAVPGSPRNPVSRGCHTLIRQGAKLVERVEDILEEIGPLAACTSGTIRKEETDIPERKALDEDAKTLLDNIGYDPIHMDLLTEATGLPARTTASLLLNLEIAGLVEFLPGDHYIRK